MAYLIDTSILGRLANAADPLHSLASEVILELHRQGEVVNITPQVLVEFRNMATRPVAVNGLGLSSAEAEAKAAVYEATFPLLAETPAIYPAWKSLVNALGIIGKQSTTPASLRLPCTWRDPPSHLQRHALRETGSLWSGHRRCGSGQRVTREEFSPRNLRIQLTLPKSAASSGRRAP